jgi:hypothetical protein
MAGARAVGPRPWSIAIASHFHIRPAHSRSRSGLRPGKRPGTHRLQAEPISAARRAVAGRCDHCVELVRADDEQHPAGLQAAPGALRHRPPVQPTAPDPAGRNRRRIEDLGRRDRACGAILRLDRQAHRPPPQRAVRPRRQSPSGGRDARGLLPRRRRCAQRRRRRYGPVLGAGVAVGHHGAGFAQPPGGRRGWHGALLGPVHRADYRLVEGPRLA